jgi:hypothetical protein
MSNLETRTKQPGRHINKLVILGFLFLTLLIVLGVVFIPWDAATPKATDLEITTPSVPARENAFTYFEAAGKMQAGKFSAADGSQRIWLDLLYEKKPDGTLGWDPVFADEVIKANAATFAELEKGLACQHYQAPPFDHQNGIHWLQSQKCLAQLLSLKSKRAHLAGDYAETGKAGLQGLQLGQQATNESNILIGWLVGVALQQIALVRLEILVADPKTPEPVLREILATLTQQTPSMFANGFKNAILGDYRWTKKTMLQDIQKDWFKKYHPIASRFIWIPYAYKSNMTLSLFADDDRLVIANADRPYAKVKLDFPSQPQLPADTFGKVIFYAKPNGIGRFLFIDGASGLPKSLGKKCQIQACFAALRLKIALRLYELKHGELPDTLNALVPEYLTEIPKDPYDDQPFRYSKTEKKVWAVGCDLIDHGGKTMNDAIMMDRPGGYDLVVSLSPRDPNPPPPAENKKP